MLTFLSVFSMFTRKKKFGKIFDEIVCTHKLKRSTKKIRIFKYIHLFSKERIEMKH